MGWVIKLELPYTKLSYNYTKIMHPHHPLRPPLSPDNLIFKYILELNLKIFQSLSLHIQIFIGKLNFQITTPFTVTTLEKSIHDHPQKYSNVQMQLILLLPKKSWCALEPAIKSRIEN